MAAPRPVDLLLRQRGILLAIVSVGAARLLASLLGAPTAVVRWFGVSWLLLAAAAYTGWRAERNGFDGYKRLYLLLLVQGFAAHAFSALGIAIGVLTATDNIYTLPDYASPFGARTWTHALGHVVLVPLGTLPLFAVACLTRLVARRTATLAGRPASA
jgi:hypothetical protein